MHGDANLTLRMTIILAILVELLICAKIRPQGLFGSGQEQF